MPVEPMHIHGDLVTVRHTEARHDGDLALAAVLRDAEDQLGLPCPVADCPVTSWYPPGVGGAEVRAVRAALTRASKRDDLQPGEVEPLKADADATTPDQPRPDTPSAEAGRAMTPTPTPDVPAPAVIDPDPPRRGR
jgi:hypothetical protein